LAAMQETAAEQEAEEAELGQCRYVMDGLEIDVLVSNEELSDRELECALFDGDIEWDGDDYEAEEVLALTGLNLGSNYEDFGSDVCLELEAEGVYYSLVLEAPADEECWGNLDWDGDELDLLEFSLLGEDVKLSNWECDTITFFKGSKHRVSEGDSLTVEYDGESYTMYFAIITEDSIFVEVGADSDEIDEGRSRVVGGLDIMVDAVLENEAGETTPDMAIVYVGNDVEVTVEDGDEYEDDSPWAWSIGCNEIGLMLVEDFDDPDDDDFPALCAGDVLCLPNDFLCIRFDGLLEEDYYTYDLDLDAEMVRVQGDFELDIEDYDEVWCGDGMFYEDDDAEDALASVLELKGSDVEIVCEDGFGGSGAYCSGDCGYYCTCSYYHSEGSCESAGYPGARCTWHEAVPATPGSVCFVDPEDGDYDVCVFGDFSDLEADGMSIANEDEDFISDFGMVIDVPEDCLEDEDCTVHVPAELMEASITIYEPAPE